MPVRKAPSAFRNLTLSALDSLASAVTPAVEGAERTALQKLADAWRGLSDADRNELLALTAAAGSVVVTAARKRVARKVLVPVLDPSNKKPKPEKDEQKKDAGKKKDKKRKKDKKDEKRKKKDRKDKKKS